MPICPTMLRSVGEALKQLRWDEDLSGFLISALWCRSWQMSQKRRVYRQR